MFLLVRSIGVLPMAQPTNSALPTGGVHRPTARLKIITTPKCTGSMPMAGLVTTGRRIGVIIVISGAISMKQPSRSSSTLIISSRTYLLLVMLSSAAVIIAGMRSSVIM